MTITIEARRLSGADLGKTIEVPLNGEWAPLGVLDAVTHISSGTHLVVNWGDGGTEWELDPTDHVTITGKDSP